MGYPYQICLINTNCSRVCSIGGNDNYLTHIPHPFDRVLKYYFYRKNVSLKA